MKPSRPFISQITEESNSVTLTQVSQQINNALNNIQQNIDMNNNRIINLKDAENEFDAINKIQLDYYVKSLVTKFAKAHDQQKLEFEQVLTTTKLEFTKLLEEKVKEIPESHDNKVGIISVPNKYYYFTFELPENPKVDVEKILGFQTGYTFLIHSILIQKRKVVIEEGSRKVSKGLTHRYYNINSTWAINYLKEANCIINFFQLFEEEKDSALFGTAGLYMQRINKKPIEFGNYIKVAYSVFKE